MAPYDPNRRTPGFDAAAEAFRSGADSPRAYLERCLAVIAEREPVVRAFVVVRGRGAGGRGRQRRALAGRAATLADRRYADGD
ncbi:hypothetical protein MKK69_18010 [Methylobacterium sp. J-026]|uniref:hypothetical protein n=1 Tax=Methylobacterium sp. J-026 TaxID=2836624 RepID=UPI001FB9D366|nr:hypothetical protein [Methylobacterium sp. J-026]MCJ2135919.1 hypothetical protein [Methylobacterium sp. J-026]